MQRHIWAVAISALAIVTPAAAQGSATATRTDAPARFELGGSFVSEDEDWCPAVQVRLNVTPGIAVEVMGVFDRNLHGIDGEDARHGFEGIYVIQARHHGRRKTFSPFFTYGLAGGFGYWRYPEVRYPFQATGDVRVIPAHTDRWLSAPTAGTVGGGLSVRLGSHASMDAGVQLFVRNGLWPSLRLGVSVPIGARR